MPNTVEQVGDDKIKLTVEVPAHDVHHAVEHAANDLAASARIPGFRKGKVPMPLLIKRVGRERLYSEAVESHIGGWFWGAATRRASTRSRNRSTTTSCPRATAKTGASRRPSRCSRSPSRPTGRSSRCRSTRPRCRRKRSRPSSRPAAQHRRARPGRRPPSRAGRHRRRRPRRRRRLGTRDYVVELGSERLVEEIENGVRGLSAGEQRDVAYELADGSRRSATVVVKEVKERVLPPLDDELAKSATEFETLDELRGEIESRLRAQIDEELAGDFAAPPSTSSSRRRTCRRPARWSSCGRASCSPAWRAASRREGSTPAPTSSSQARRSSS